MKRKMKNLKGLLPLLVLLLLFAPPAKAQDEVKEGAKYVTDLLKAQLSLTEDQYTKVYDINVTFFSKAKELQALDEGKMGKVEKLKPLDKERDAKLKAVLSAVQFKTFLSNKKANRRKLLEYYQSRKKE